MKTSPENIATYSNLVNEIKEGLELGSVNAFGLPGAGKDSQGGALIDALGISERYPVDIKNRTIPLGSGDISRKAAESGEMDQKEKEVMESGGLISSKEFFRIVPKVLTNPDYRDIPLVLSSVGRMNGEQQRIHTLLSGIGHATRVVPYLEITEDEYLRRLDANPSRGRKDDSPEARKKRVEAFMDQTVPVIEWYDQLGLLVVVDAMPDEHTVFRSMVHQIHDRLTGRG